MFDSSLPTFVLYADIARSEFKVSNPTSIGLHSSISSKNAHTILAEAAERNIINYIFRHFRNETGQLVPTRSVLSFKEIFSDASRHVQVTGYGVELAVKQSEYKAVDDARIAGKKKGRHFASSLIFFRRGKHL